MSDTVEIIERYMKPTVEYPVGSYLRTVGGEVQVATGFYAVEHPGKPSWYFHGGPPFVVIDWGGELPWEKK